MDDNQPTNTTTDTTASTTPVTPVTTSQAEKKSSFTFDEVSVMAALSYVGPLVIIPFLTHKENSFVMFHIKQGLVLLVLSILIYVAGGLLFFLWPLIGIINLGLLCLSIIGIVRALQKKEEELPIVGKYAHHIKL